MATFILVHGTFAKAAHWPALRDGLALAASAVGEHSQFVELKWSSKNRTSARQVAATELSSVVQDLQRGSRNIDARPDWQQYAEHYRAMR
jgi:hypothetical protein